MSKNIFLAVLAGGLFFVFCCCCISIIFVVSIVNSPEFREGYCEGYATNADIATEPFGLCK